MPTALIITTAGINCDLELGRAFELAGARPEFVHLNRLLDDPDLLERFDLIGVPGGFSYGDAIAAGRIAAALMSIQAIKAVEIGDGLAAAALPGSAVHDALGRPGPKGPRRRSNRAGGLEGGMTNGMPIVVRGVMKPISTLLRGLDSVNLQTRQPERSDYERSDICAVPAAGVVAEHVVAFEIARAFLEKFSGDTLREVRAAYDYFLRSARRLGSRRPEPESFDRTGGSG